MTRVFAYRLRHRLVSSNFAHSHLTSFVSPSHLEQRLKNLPAHGTRLPDAADGHAVWAFTSDGQTYHLHFYAEPARGKGVKCFFELQAMQKAEVLAERPVALLTGFRLAAAKGDAVIVRPVERGRALGRFLLDLYLEKTPVPDRKRLVDSIIGVCVSLRSRKRQIGRAGLDALGVAPDGTAFVLDPLALRRGAASGRDLIAFGRTASRYATRTELLRGWRRLTGTARPPKSRGKWPAVRLRPAWSFGLRRFDANGWTFHYADRPIFPQRHSRARDPEIDLTAWPAVWTDLLAHIERGDLDVLKRDPSGDVLTTAVRLGAADLQIVIKRPRRKSTLRELTDAFRTPRARRTWRKAWNLLALGFPVEQPLLLAERRRGRVIESMLIFERVPGPTLAAVDLNALPDAARDALLRRCGRLLRRLEREGFCHFDSKSTNWIVYNESEPVLLDLDGIRPYRWDGFGLRRLLRAVRHHPQFRETDAAAVESGYSPFQRKSTNEHE